MTVTARIPEQGDPKMSLKRKSAWSGMALLSVAVALVSYRYLFGKGPVPYGTAANRHFNFWIVVHAGSAATALLLGPLQFLPILRQHMPALHRVIGRFYVAGCLSGGTSALVLATGVSAGPLAGTGFAALGAAWLVTTGIAVRQIAMGDVASHQRWMIRSFALTLSAVTLRLYLPLSGALGVTYLPAYRAIAWLCWVPNILAAEWYLGRSSFSVQPSSAA